MLSRRRQKTPMKGQQMESDRLNETPLRGVGANGTIDSAQSNGPQHLSIPAIYAAPTVDTLDDESIVQWRGAYTMGASSNGIQSARNVRKPEEDEMSGVTRHHVSFTPTSIDSSFSFNNRTYSCHHSAVSPTRKKASEHPESPPQPKLLERQQQAGNEKQKQKRRNQQHGDFQHEGDAMTVSVRSVNVAQRSAFAASPPVSIEEWHMAAQRLGGKNESSSSSALTNAHKKLSPSLQLLKLLHSMQSLNSIRQLNFSPSVGIDSDIFVPWWADVIPARDDISSNKENKLRRRSSIVAEQRDGRYRSIHPVQAILLSLPVIPPSLSNKKARLPMRSDVGFPNASEEEVTKKAAEINCETEWEEASPRLIVLVTSDDLGTAVQEDNPDPIIHPNHWEWNGGGLQGMPWAGRELLRAKELNALHFSRKSSILAKNLASKPQYDQWNEQNENMVSAKQKLLEPNRTSVLAPPLDASYSKTLGWRPRPFHDRQPGMEYLLSWPLNVSVDVHEPLLCSLALYNLPTNEFESSGGLGVYGKISEEFWFPAGDWEGKIEVDLAFLKIPSTDGSPNSSTILDKAKMIHALSMRKQKAIFSYDPLVITGGKRSLFWVLQIHKVANDDLTAVYLSKGSHPSSKRSNVKKLFKGKPPSRHQNGTVPEQTNFEGGQANKFFTKFGTNLLSPLAFGVQSILENPPCSNSEEKAKVLFPQGNLRELSLLATSPVPESQEDFVRRLSNLVSKTDFSPDERWLHLADGGPAAEFSCTHTETSQTSDACEIGSTASSVSVCSTINLSSHMTGSYSSDRQNHRSTVSRQKSSSPARKKKSLKQRIWMSPVKSTISMKSLTPSIQRSVSTTNSRWNDVAGGIDDTAKQINTPFAATASIFTSVLNADWLEVLLKDPTDLDGFNLFQLSQTTSSSTMPKLLCDVSGDFAVMLEERGLGKKRSNLVRTQPHMKPAGYTIPSDIREVLFLPARPEKQYDIDIPPSFRSLVNLLYLYPRLLRYAPEQHNANSRHKKQETRPRYTVRVRLVRSSLEANQMGTIASSQEILEAFHSPSPWAGSPLLDEVYTKLISHEAMSQLDKDSKAEQPMRDEFKLRLPTILDGTFFLHFTLLELDPDSNLRTVTENSIPLSSSNLRDSAGGSKVATCIPNGCHRVKLGDFRLYIDSRLVSSIHIADAAVAAAVRDFPVAISGKQNGGETDMLDGAPAPSTDEGKISGHPTLFRASFSTASGGTLVGHFQLLLYIHLRTLLSPCDVSTPNYATLTKDSMMESLRSLFEVLGKVKTRLGPGRQKGALVRTGTRKRLEAFLKSAIDEFEEKFLDLPGQSGYETINETSANLGSDIHLVQARTASTAGKHSAVDEGDNEEELLDEGALRFRKDSLQNGIDRRLNRRISKGKGVSSGTSLSRVAYGASKTDRMKVEAELHYDGGRFTHFFDDDETIVTSGTALHNSSDLKQKQEADAPFRSQQGGNKLWAIDQKKSQDDLYSEISMKTSTAAAARSNESKTNGASSLDAGFATRVKTVASVMLAPCVGNSKTGSSPRRLSLDCGRSSRRRRRDATSKAELTLGEKTAKTAAEEKIKRPEMFVFPGSDVEDEDEGGGKRQPKYTSFRGRLALPLLFTARGSCLDQCNGVVLGGKHIYETLLILWLQVWLEQITSAKVPAFDSPATNCMLLDFFSHKDMLLPLILKSIALRHGSFSNDEAKAVLDWQHLSVLTQFVEMLACCLMGQALVHSQSTIPGSRDSSLMAALASSDVIVDFFIGLFAILHPEHMRALMEKYFKTLRESETENKNGLADFEWTEQSIFRVKSSRQLRLRALEKLAVMPSFLALNFPLKFSDCLPPVAASGNDVDSTWKMQYNESGGGDATSMSRGQRSAVDKSSTQQIPVSGWLARLLADEAFTICALSCEAVVTEAIRHIEQAQMNSQGNMIGPTKRLQLGRWDLLMFQSLAIHSITAVYELVLRRHAMDRRFQTDTCRGRIAALHTECLFTHSLLSVRWLARMESTHKVRSIWMLCFVYILQEAPEVLIRDLVRSYCDPSDILVHRFIRLLRLGSSTFQSFVDQSRHSTFPNEIDESLSPWLLQESFNTILNATNIVVEECAKLTEWNPQEKKRLMNSILDLFLHILTTPQSAVTHLRAVGGSLQALEQFGVAIFLDAVGNTLQHWLRVILSLMNSTSLSVRSISVDFVLSLLGSAFDLFGNVDDILLNIASIAPEVVGREIGLYSVDGHVRDAEDLERSIWPLRRSFADLEDANPIDDDRIDPELYPVLKTFCRASQAVLDGVLIELRLKKDMCIVGIHLTVVSSDTHIFDADEESLVEAANFFLPETAPLQRIRWLRTLNALHKAKGQWLEAAEALMACAYTISDAIPHLGQVWRPSTFLLWSDARRSTWLQTVGEEIGHPGRNNDAVMAFSDEFLEPGDILGHKRVSASPEKLQKPTLAAMCTMLTSVTKEAVDLYLREEMAELAYSRLEKLLQILMGVISDLSSQFLDYRRNARSVIADTRKRYVEEEALLRRVSATLSGSLVGLLVEEAPGAVAEAELQDKTRLPPSSCMYVLVTLSGKKPPRFQESTTLPTFLDWNTPCVCRVSKQQVNDAHKASKGNVQMMKKHVCLAYGKVLKASLAREMPQSLVKLCVDTGTADFDTKDDSTIYVELAFLNTDLQLQHSLGQLESKRFFYKTPERCHQLISLQGSSNVVGSPPADGAPTIVEVTVAHSFPSILARQRALLTSKIKTK